MVTVMVLFGWGRNWDFKAYWIPEDVYCEEDVDAMTDEEREDWLAAHSVEQGITTFDIQQCDYAYHHRESFLA